MTPADDFDEASERGMTELREQINYLQQALTAISSGGVDAVVIGAPEQEQIYTLTSADRPYRVIVERMGEGAATVSERGVILFANLQLAAFLEVDRDSMVGRDIVDFVNDVQRPALETLLTTRSTEILRSELSIATAGGVEVPVLVAATALDIEGVLVRCLVFTDLTMNKRIERQIALDAAHLERQRVAREVNDTIVQGLVTAEMALDFGLIDQARLAISRTSAQARNWIGELAVDQRVNPGSAVRSAPARQQADPT